MTTPAYTSNLPVETQQLGLKTLDVTGEVVVTRGGTQLVCAACDAPFTIDAWLMRPYRDNGDLFHEECDTDRQGNAT